MCAKIKIRLSNLFGLITNKIIIQLNDFTTILQNSVPALVALSDIAQYRPCYWEWAAIYFAHTLLLKTRLKDFVPQFSSPRFRLPVFVPQFSSPSFRPQISSLYSRLNDPMLCWTISGVYMFCNNVYSEETFSICVCVCACVCACMYICMYHICYTYAIR